MTNHDDLVKKYHTDPDTLDPETRARSDELYAQLKEKWARGETAPPNPRHTFAPGLDDQYQPYPVSDD